MTAPTIADTLKFANLQMAAEALYEFNATLANANLEPGKKFNESLDTGRFKDILTDGTLMGGAGDDRYSFAIGDGQDKIIDTTGTDTVAFGPELNAADLTVAQRTDAGGRWLDLAFVGGDSVAIKDRKERTMKINDMAWRRAA